MKKIILLIDNLGSGGAQRQLVNLAVLLKKRGYDTSMLVYSDVPFFKAKLEENNVPVKLIKVNGTVARMLQIRKYLRKSDADVVIPFLEIPCFLACFSKMGGAKWKLITNELSAKNATFTSRRNRIFNFFERFSDAKIGNSENAIKLWKKYYPQYNDKYGVIYNPVVIPEETVSHSLKHTRGERFRLTVAASYQGLKNPLRVIEAVSLLDDDRKSRLDLQWYGKIEVTTGDTRVYERAVQMVSELQLSSCITLNPETKEIYQIMAVSDAVGLFSTVEGLPNTICEGMMLAKPIVMSTVSDWEVLTEGNGFSCDPNSAESIRDAIAGLLDADDTTLARMGKCSREKALSLFDQDVTVGKWIELIEHLTEDGRMDDE